MLGFFNKLKKFNAFKRGKKSSTLAGALVFFTLLGLVPSAYLISLLIAVFGKELTFLTDLITIIEFDEVKNFLLTTTKKLSTGGNLIAGLIAIYSSANLFVHLKLTGEFIYNCKPSGGFIVRVFSIIGTVLISLTLTVLMIIYAFLSTHVKRLLGNFLGTVLNVAVLFLISLIAVVFINFFTCPYRIRLNEVIKGSLYTCVFSVVFTFVFIIYVKYFASYSEVYGKIASIPVFCGWLFVVMRCLVMGVIINAYTIGTYNKKLTLNGLYSKIRTKKT